MASQFFTSRMEPLGITEEMNNIQLLQYDAKLQENYYKDFPIFRDTDQGIDILVYSLNRELINYAKEGSRYKINEYCITRLKDPIVKKDGSIMKYKLPRGQGTHPFFHPWLCEQYEKRNHIDTLFLTEGYFKAFKGCMHGIATVGLTSITHMKSKETGTLHPDILSLISTCRVKRVVWLTDGDCLDITSKELKDGIDLTKRPNNFFNSVVTFRNMLADMECDLWFMHVDSLGMGEKTGNGFTPGPKGLDDLLIAKPNELADIVEDIHAFSRPGKYFIKFPVTHAGQESKVLNHFHLRDVNDFYSFHIEYRPDLEHVEFVWYGNKYKYDAEKGQCILQAPAEAKNYFRVGDQYYEFIWVPDKHNNLQKLFHGRQKGTITDDHGKNFFKHVPKYKAFCNVPDHTNYQQVRYNCFNLYAPFDHEPEAEACTAEDCPTIMGFLQHIFGTGSIHYSHMKTKEHMEISKIDLALDYLQLLYQRPTQILPILCLVSKENETGKSTMAKFLKYLFTQNCAIVGNADLANDFNSSWASKLLIICDEAKIEKNVVVEKVKSLSTADKIMINAKGKDQVELDFFGKFIFLTNNEENFIYASEEDLRYWVIKVPRITQKNPDLEDQLKEEVPAFLSFLSRRKMATDRLTRMWFDPVLLKTDALKKVIKYSRPTIEKELHQYMNAAFIDFGVQEIRMALHDIHRVVFNNRFEKNYLERTLKEDMKIDLYWEPHPEEKDLFGKPLRMYKVCRYKYPKWEKKFVNGTEQMERVEVTATGRPYVFTREMFVTQEEEKQLLYDPETAFTNDMLSTDNGVGSGGGSSSIIPDADGKLF